MVQGEKIASRFPRKLAADPVRSFKAPGGVGEKLWYYIEIVETDDVNEVRYARAALLPFSTFLPLLTPSPLASVCSLP